MANDDPEDVELDPPLQDGDEPEDLQDQAVVDAEADEEPEQDQIDAQPPQQSEQQRQPSRGESRHQRLANELRSRDDQIHRLNQRLDAILTAQNQPRQPQGETPEQRAQRRALMTPEEAIRDELNETKQSFAQQLYQNQLQNQDVIDRAAYQTLGSQDRRFKRIEAEVEVELGKLRSSGQNISRENLAYWLLGKQLIASQTKAQQDGTAARQRAQAQRRVQGQQTRPANSGSDVSTPRRDRTLSLERRLENVEL